MKKDKTLIIEYTKPPHLFRDELLAIESILKNDLNGRELKITFDNFDSENISSIPLNHKPSNNLSFHISTPYFSVEVRRFSSRFYAADDSLQIRGAINMISDVFNASPRRFLRLRQLISDIMSVLGVLSLFALIAIWRGNVEILKVVFYSSGVISFMLVTLPFLCFVSSFQMYMPSEPIIEFEMRNNRKNFWERNKEQIYVGLIVGVPVAIVSFLLGLLTGRI